MTTKSIPQVIAVVPVSKEGKISLVKEVRSHLGLAQTEGVSLEVDDEILLYRAGDGADGLGEAGRGSFLLPTGVVETLGMTPDSNLIALVQRPGAVAVKRLETREFPGEWAKFSDLETPRLLTRRLETNPMPDDLLPALCSLFEGQKLKFDVIQYLVNKKTLAAWKTRKLLLRPESGDSSLQEKLIADRLAAQRADGSWGSDLFQTARGLRELAELGLSQSEQVIRLGVEWLLDRAQSEANPGMFFGSDGLVTAQADVLRERAQTGKGRFREIRGPEKRAVMGGDNLIKNPCGPRIMWPNALALETLLKLGYENQARVQTALDVLASRDWCECGYQLGMAQWGSVEPVNVDSVSAFEQECINQYKYGGLRDPSYLAREATLAKRTHITRFTHQNSLEGDIYDLLMPDHIQGCEFITTRALSQVTRPLLRRFAEAHLWRFAGIQRPPDGRFPEERYGTGFDQAGILEAVSRYDHPAAKVIVMRSIPWILVTQNPDGSWGSSETRDFTTWAVVKALLSLEKWLPEAFIPSLASEPG